MNGKKAKSKDFKIIKNEKRMKTLKNIKMFDRLFPVMV